MYVKSSVTAELRHISFASSWVLSKKFLSAHFSSNPCGGGPTSSFAVGGFMSVPNVQAQRPPPGTCSACNSRVEILLNRPTSKRGAAALMLGGVGLATL